ncbi:hypothetical protein [uncultured Cohaesibacter sp.]|uniref:hypothetical protein n=1 Tax=uncultured Cohaesibacter sp. TaxID=1002546 RepID=UPI0029C7C682|nr:hypothetical protein [uncultured Cohaesibacter sp.]
MTFDELTSGPCALPQAPMAMPTQILERPRRRRYRLMASLRVLLRTTARLSRA